MRFNPGSDLEIGEGDTLVVLGHRENLRRLARLAQA
jgi:K+/H+ antiporter YhaU regulatory subunit KhtT